LWRGEHSGRRAATVAAGVAVPGNATFLAVRGAAAAQMAYSASRAGVLHRVRVSADGGITAAYTTPS